MRVRVSGPVQVSSEDSDLCSTIAPEAVGSSAVKDSPGAIQAGSPVPVMNVESVYGLLVASTISGFD